jgi:hypothetical protein
MATAVVMAAVASPFDEPQHLLRATEESPDLADVHVRLAFFPTLPDKQSYEAPLEKFHYEPLVFGGGSKRFRVRLKFKWMEYADRGEVRDVEWLPEVGAADHRRFRGGGAYPANRYHRVDRAASPAVLRSAGAADKGRGCGPRGTSS